MPRKKPTEQSVARAERQRVASEEGARAMAEFQQDGVAARKNMARLRELREAREAAEAAKPPAAPVAKVARKKKVSPAA